MYCFINGNILPVEEAKIGITDIGLLRSYAVFDYMRTYNGKPFGFEDYIVRFRNSAESLRLQLNYTDEEIKSTIIRLVEKSNVKEAGVRLLLTGGYSSDSISFDNPNFIIVIEKLPVYPSSYYQHGVKLITDEFQRAVAGSKTTDYLNAIKLEPIKKEKGAFDILYHKNNLVLEVARNNIFFFKNNTLITPKDDILKGITRKHVLLLAKDHFKIEERAVSVSEMWDMDEVFLTGTSKKIIPVVQIDEQHFSNGKPGANTKKLMEVFDVFVNNY